MESRSCVWESCQFADIDVVGPLFLDGGHILCFFVWLPKGCRLIVLLHAELCCPCCM
jgi:hypothetical protein